MEATRFRVFPSGGGVWAKEGFIDSYSLCAKFSGAFTELKKLFPLLSYRVIGKILFWGFWEFSNFQLAI